MNSLILFLNAFLSYFLLLVLIVALMGIALFCGVKMRKAKAKKEALLAEQVEQTE